jgi:hypothetical protein
MSQGNYDYFHCFHDDYNRKEWGEGNGDRETERQRDRETERQRDRETERQRDRETERQNVKKE